MRVFLPICGLGLFLVLGCNATADRAAWERGNGGLLHDQHESLAQAALNAVDPPPQTAVRISVLNTTELGAFSWPDGSIFLTRGLVDLLEQQELAAAIAHELGHLLDDGHLQVPASLRGSCRDSDAEVRADAIGVELLEQQGIAPKPMISMLRKVHASTVVTSSCRTAISKRLEILSKTPSAHAR